MMDHVVQNHSAQDLDARHSEESLPAVHQRPYFLQVFIAGLGDGGASGRDVLVKEIEQLLAGLHDCWLPGSASRGCKVEGVALKSSGSEATHLGDVSRQPAHRH